MFALYVTKVLEILGGLRDTAELAMVRNCFDSQTPPKICAVLIQNRR